MTERDPPARSRFAATESASDDPAPDSGSAAQSEPLIQAITGRVVVVESAGVCDHLDRYLSPFGAALRVLSCDRLADRVLSDLDDPAGTVGLAPYVAVDPADATALLERAASVAQIFVALVSLLDPTQRFGSVAAEPPGGPSV